MSTLTSTDNNFSRDIANGFTLVDFWAPWCGPCQVMGPILDELSEVMRQSIRVMKHNVDNEPDTSGKFGVRGIPTMILFKDGKEIDRYVGVHMLDDLKTSIEKHIAK